MADPFTLAAVGAVALTEGFKFWYQQAGETIKRWQQRMAAVKGAEPVPVKVELPSTAFAGQLEQPRLNFEVVARLEEDLKDLRATLAADGAEQVDTADEALLQTVDTLRGAMEAAYGQRITFAGETSRPPSGPLAVGEVHVDDVFGYAAGLRARKIIGGHTVSRSTAKRVAPGAQLVGLEADTIGEEARNRDN
jgi:hypothetical protein